ncbi:signal peptide protein, partial [Bradyrhizobium sp. DOA1]
AKLNQLGVPVKLAIGLDSVFKTKLSTGAERYINIYIGDGPGEPVRRAEGFRGKLDNVDVRGTGVGHVSIDKNEAIQRRVIAEIDAAIMRSRAPVAPIAEPRAPRSSHSAAAAPSRN